MQGLPQAYPEELATATKVRKRIEGALFNVEGVVGMGIGLSDTVSGKAVIEVYVKKLAHLRGIIPETLENIPVKIVEPASSLPIGETPEETSVKEIRLCSNPVKFHSNQPILFLKGSVR